MVSVIIPHRNSFDSLEKLILSIDKSNTQIIIVDDNSEDKDRLYNISLKYPFCTFIRNKVCKGAGFCRNKGLELASHDWILFADADDYFCSGAFDVFNEYLETEYDVVYFNVTSYNVLLNKRGDRHKVYSNLVDNEDKDIIYQHYVPWGKLIKRELIDKNKIFFDETFVSNDMMFSLFLGLRAKLINFDKRILYTVTESANSLTKVINKDTMLSRFLISKKHNEVLKKNGVYNYKINLLKYFYYSRSLGYKFLFKLLYYYVK
ncbi:MULTISPECIES: glycosyltransferase family 2 protein [unclassified Pseudoalteromonas]|uniref:glycosyltransferase family 2 protein n=1 Tax=unclassified Pseudoalteromonas TaxID=194690 RepID=UPI0025B482DC|nr:MULTISPECIES: glycosyltransferase family 2 protein [unclassified Pseudoalteromonas]MDN3379127.1 glycosyltransferase family 2 protein [Pseudoalteromonas sp. APC 3893]MDN3389221.1 glycosyltransferase family 2 protein [Pseudoalteromonas sp. APC 4017]